MTSPQPTCAACGAPLEPDAAFCKACGVATGVAPPPPDLPTLERLKAALAGRYAVERLLGEGGMATVYLAQDVRHDRPVAIKVLHPEIAAEIGPERFLREIKLAAKLQHPHILGLYDSGEADGLLFYVMPFVQGESLRDKIDREQQLSVDDALGITLEVADALGYAHAQGIVHRDIKPENIMLQGGHALVADFGIARAISDGGSAHKLTKTGTAIGTPLYMSPEQAYGDEVGPTSDLYSLACVSYEMFTGQPPFTGANARAIMARHTMEMVPGIRVVRDTVPEEVEEALLAALAKTPADRPQSCAEFATMLGTPLGAGAVRRSRFTQAARSGPREAVRRAAWWRRPGVVAGAALVLAAAGTGGWFALRPRAPVIAADGLDPRGVAVLYFDDAGPAKDLGYLADGLTEGLIGALSEVQNLHVITRGGAEQVRGSTLSADSIARIFGVGMIVRGAVVPEGERVKVDVRLVDGASGADIERASFTAPKADLLALADSLARQAATFVRRRLGEQVRVREQRAGTRSIDAWVLVQRAERLRKQADSARAAGALEAFDRDLTAADTLAAQAEALDRRWVEPIVLRAGIAYRRSRLAVDDLPAADRWIAVGLAHLERAFALERRDPDALELRGNLQYWRWLLGLEPDARRAEALLGRAKADLDSAVGIRPSQAGAWATLSHMAYQNGTSADIRVATQRAWEADAFLSNADVILQRLFFASYDLDQADAGHWCDLGARRFPASPRFIECRLWMLTMRGATPDPVRARALADTLVAATPAQDTAYQRLNAGLIVAAVLARAGQTDSAKVLAERYRGNATVDPTRDLANIAAFVHTVAGDHARALEQLTLYLAANPRRRSALAADPGWWFSPLVAEPGWRQLVGSRAGQ